MPELSLSRLEKAVLKELKDDEFDWVRTKTVAKLVGEADISKVETALEALKAKNLVRNPVRASATEKSSWRLTSKKLTFGEKLRKLKAFIGREDGETARF